MSRTGTGKSGTVTVGGTTIEHVIDWTLDPPNHMIGRHYSAYSSSATAVVLPGFRTGTITVESDDDDSGQSTLLGSSPTSVSNLILYEDGTVTHTITSAYVRGGVTLPKRGKVIRIYTWEEL